jgi:acetyltransferase-like isoleucine patch superfamily enzyme
MRFPRIRLAGRGLRPSALVRRLEDALVRRRADPDGERIARLRARGVKIGQRCLILSDGFSTEPYLIEIGDHVAISSGVSFVTHEGAAWLLREEHPSIQAFGRIVVGADSMIGMNSIILPGTTIGRRCVIGAGAVVKGDVPDGSVCAGNPARLIKTTEALLASLVASPNRLDLYDTPEPGRRAALRRHFGIG